MTGPSRPGKRRSFRPIRQAITQSDHLSATTNSERRLGAARGDVGGAGGFTQIIHYCASSPASPRTVPGSWIGWRDHPGGSRRGRRLVGKSWWRAAATVGGAAVITPPGWAKIR